MKKIHYQCIDIEMNLEKKILLPEEEDGDETDRRIRVQEQGMGTIFCPI